MRIQMKNPLPEHFPGRSPLDRTKNFALFCCLLLFKAASAQVPDSTAANDTLFYYTYIPKYEWSVGIEHSYIPGMFAQDAFYPDNIEISFWAHQRLYLRAGAFHIGSITQINPSDPNLNIPGDTVSKAVYFQAGSFFYAGGTLKLFLFRNAYFTPSIDFYFDKYSITEPDSWSISVGPSAAIEYFISNRFSLRADLFNINIGIGSSGKFPLLTTHRILGLGVRYSFDMKKVSSE